MDNIRIRCPKCESEHDSYPHWQCSCGHCWDTFSTGGSCPACGRVWKETQCPNFPRGCLQWSPHLDWYEALDEIVSALKESIKESWKQVMV